jgi:hypothetical protein
VIHAAHVRRNRAAFFLLPENRGIRESVRAVRLRPESFLPQPDLAGTYPLLASVVDKRKMHAMHETAHALAGHAHAMTIRSITINVTGQSGADVDRENDPANVNDKIRSKATPEEISALLPSMRRSLAVTVAGIVTENLRGVFTTSKRPLQS